jgi:hypothetical protein
MSVTFGLCHLAFAACGRGHVGNSARAERRLWRLMASKTEETPQKEEMLEMEGPENPAG